MRTHLSIGAMVAVAGLATGALAQDSTSVHGGLPGDALEPYDLNEQIASYVVDLVPFTTSKGHCFGIAPIIKSTRTDPAFFNNLTNAQFISEDLLKNVPFASNSYAYWNIPTAGINSGDNANPVTTYNFGANNLSSQLAVVMGEFGTTAGVNNYNGVIGACLNYIPSQPQRLYVTRNMAAVNAGSATLGDDSQFGVGSVDASGNVYFRADDFGLTGPVPITGNNLYRTRLKDRDPVLNHISGNPGTSDATDQLLIGSGTVHATPNNVPSSIIGGPGAVATATFGTTFARGPAAPLTTDASHINTASDHRGSLGGSKHDILDAGIYTFGMLTQDAAGDTNQFNVWSVNGGLAVTEVHTMPTPGTVTDNSDGFTLIYGTPEYQHYRSQASFRGGVGQVALGRDQAGNGLAAATIHENGGIQDDFSNQILIRRFDDTGAGVPPAGGGSPWTMVAYIDQAFIGGTSGKKICDAAGDTIGVLTPLFNVTGGAPLGPSMSTPVIDGAGNVWFLSAVELFDAGGGPSDFDTALIRAIYDPTSFSYTLELVLQLGSTFRGLNSDRNWTITFFNIADSNSISSATMFSGNGRSCKWDDAQASLDPSDPRTNGGIVVQANILYDANDDGTFDITLGDEAYQSLLFIGCVNKCPADLAPPFGVLDFFDVLEFLGLFDKQHAAADIAAPFGTWDFFDVLEFLGQFDAGCP